MAEKQLVVFERFMNRRNQSITLEYFYLRSKMNEKED